MISSLRRLPELHRRLHPLTMKTKCCAALLAGATAVAIVSAMSLHMVHTASAAPLAAAPALTADTALAGNVAAKRRHILRRHSLLNSLGVLNPLSGVASWYGEVLHGHTTASGDIFDESELTAAHRTLPFGTRVRVTDTHTQRSVIVRINDRGVLAPDRVIDLSSAAATELGILRMGLAKVKLEILPRHAAQTQRPEGGE